MFQNKCCVSVFDVYYINGATFNQRVPMSNGSVNSKHAHLLDICHFVLEQLQMPLGGA